MGLIVCCACERQREVEHVKRARLVCSNCGASQPRVIHRRKVYSDWEPRDGKPQADAWRDVYAGLKWLQAQKQFKPKYADAKFKHIFDRWPPDDIVEVAPYAPTAELMSWITRSNEQWKRTKRAEEKGGAASHVERNHTPPPSSVSSVSSPEVSFMTPEDWEVKLG